MPGRWIASKAAKVARKFRPRGRRSYPRRRRPSFARRLASAFVLAGILLVAGMMGLILLSMASMHVAPPNGTNGALHQHLTIEIVVEGMAKSIPPNIGVDPGLWNDHSMDYYSAWSGESSIQTRDASGTVHVEMSHWHLCTLGDFFDVWGQAFDKNHLMSYTGAVTLTVSGQADDAFRDLPLQDGQRILIRAE